MPYLSLKKEIKWGNKFLLHIAKWIKKFLFSITSAWQRKIIDTFSLLHLFKTAFFHSNNNESTFYKTDVIPIKKICDYCMLGKWPKNIIVVYFPTHLNQYVFPDVKENILDKQMIITCTSLEVWNRLVPKVLVFLWHPFLTFCTARRRLPDTRATRSQSEVELPSAGGLSSPSRLAELSEAKRKFVLIDLIVFNRLQCNHI